MNAAVRAVVRMGLYVGAKVYFIHEVSRHLQVGTRDATKWKSIAETENPKEETKAKICNIERK